MAEEKRDESFRVIDRRLFSAEGELRKDVLEEKAREEAQKPPEPPPRAAQKPGGSPAGDAAAPSRAVDPAPSRSFQAIIGILAQNAELFLGAYPDPRTGQAVLNLDGAREMIDMLDALREKTRGNLAPEEERLLLDVLGSLKLTYMEVSKAAAQAMREKPARRS